MESKTLTVLIATYNDRVNLLDRVFAEAHPHMRYIVVHQVDDQQDYNDVAEKMCQGRNDIDYVLSSTTGVTKSRNIALSLVSSDYAVFMDDDVRLADNFYDTIIASFQSSPESSVLTFQAADIEEGGLLKNYLTEQKTHTRISILKVGTIEVAFDVKAVKNCGAMFPEYLGAGTSLPACDEPVFLARVMSRGLTLTFIPKVIVFHPKLSSGKEFITENSLVCRGVAFRDIFGRVSSIPVIVLFYLKNRKKFKLTGQSALLALFKGYFKTHFNESV
ncbi:glycosyltransferase family 2 protein [Shewanella halifaxensis]|uniref:glycosyltransferase family 2 protein n=1 Tax=Shewanella halifaxensis TaxID=271098 RepID=UPI000D58DFAE|nr:glycosyltransferase family 2 protein [Shewanella halifaxensis]